MEFIFEALWRWVPGKIAADTRRLGQSSTWQSGEHRVHRRGRSLALQQASIGAVPAFDPDRCASALHAKHRPGPIFDAKGRQRPPARIDHAQPPGPVHDDSRIVAGLALRRNLKNIADFLKETVHTRAYRSNGEGFRAFPQPAYC